MQVKNIMLLPHYLHNESDQTWKAYSTMSIDLDAPYTTRYNRC